MINRLKALYNNLRIKHKLIVLILFVMVVLALIGSGVQKYAFDFYDEELYIQSSRALSLSSLSIENELKRMQKLSYLFATDPSIQQYLRIVKNGGSDYDNYAINTPFRERLVSIGALDKYVLSVQVYDVNGRAYSSGRNEITISSERIDKIKKESALLKGGNTWIPRGSNDEAIIAAREIRNSDKLQLDYLGTLAMRIDMDKLFADLSQGVNDRGAQLVILSNSEMIYTDAPELPLELLTELSGSQGYKIMNFDDRRYFITYVASTYTDWTYYTLIPYDNIFERLVKVKQTIIVIFAFLVIIIIIFFVRFSKRITEPIESLNAKMKRVQLGNFDYIEEPNGQSLAMDEAGQMHRNFRIMVERINDLIHENYVKQLTIRETELKALQAQINPHFLYNTLESINWTAKLNNQTHISQMVEALGSLLRTSISHKEPLIPLSQELEMVGHYVTIQRFRFEERLDFVVDVSEKLLSQQIPKLSLQPLVENAVNYGLEQMIDTCSIRVRAYVEEEKVLLIEVSDNGPGMEAEFVERLLTGEVVKKGSGIGLKNIEDRIKLLYGDEYGLLVRSKLNGGTTVRLRLPYERRNGIV